MKLILERLYSSKIILLFYILLPIVEVLTTFLIINYNTQITPGMIYKSLFTIYSIIYLLLVDKKHKKMNFVIVFSLFLYTTISFFVTISEFTLINILNKIIILSRFICFPIITLFLYRIIKNDIKLNAQTISYSAGIYGFIMFIAGMTGTALPSYSQGLAYGNCGWFYSGNEISNLLSMFYPLLIYYIAKNKTTLSMISLAFVTYGLMVIGTKTSLFALVIVTLTMFIFSSCIYIIKRNNISKNISIICIILGIFYTFTIPATPAYKYMLLRYNDSKNIININNKQNNTLNSMDRFIYNGREIDLYKQKKIYLNSSFLEKTFGINDNTKTVTATGDYNIIERDLYDVIFIHGFIGLIVFFIPLFLVFFSFFRHVFNNFKYEINNNKFSIGSSVLIAIGISHIAGHVFLAPGVAMYLAFICVKLSIKEEVSINKKSIIIYMPKLSSGGMERSLINFLNISKFIKKYNVTLCLGYVTNMQYLNDIPKDITIRILAKKGLYKFGKVKCVFNYCIELLRCFNNNYDISICYSYHHQALSILTRLASKNTVLFMHTDLINSRSIEEIRKLNKKVEIGEFKVIVCVSKAAEDSILKLYPKLSQKTIVANNYIDGNNILQLSKKEIACEIKKNVPIFINVSRHFEKAKKISRIIEAAKLLKLDGYDFVVWLIGDGEDSHMYKETVEKNNLQNIIIFMGEEVNPYRYLAKSNCLIVSSEFEGYGIVIDEARVLNIPVISTDVGDAKKILHQGYGIISEKSVDGIYNAMKDYIKQGYNIKQKFNYKEFNSNVDKQLLILEDHFKLKNKKDVE